MLKNKGLILCAFWLCLGAVCMAQSNTKSPYSRYGYGKLADNSIGMSRGMGGIGYGLRNSQQINVMNPASYAAMDSLTFLFDIGANIQNSKFSEGGNRGSNFNGGLDYVVLQFPVTEWMAISAGLIPFTFVGYDYGQNVNDTILYHSGTGGLSEAYIGMGANVYKGLSVGVNFNYLFGNITYADEVYMPNSYYAQDSRFDQEMRVKDYRLLFGAQYTYQLNKKESLTVGATFSPKKTLLGHITTQKAVYTSGSTSDAEIDTISRVGIKNAYELPNSFGVGIAYTRDRNLSVGLDVTYQNWADVKFDNRTDSLSNRFKIAVGGEWIPDIYSRKYWNKIRYRAGAFYNRSYEKVQESKLNEYGVSCGLGFPLRNDKSIVNVALEYVRQEPTVKYFVKEDYFRISFSLSFNEMWFFKSKLE